MARSGGSSNFPEDCLKVLTEREGDQALSVEVTKALSEDVTYRLKELTHVS